MRTSAEAHKVLIRRFVQEMDEGEARVRSTENRRTADHSGDIRSLNSQLSRLADRITRLESRN